MVVAGYVTGLMIFNLMAALLCYDFCCCVSSTSRLCTLVNRWQIVKIASDGNRKMQSTMTEDQVVVVIEGVNVEAKSKKSAANKEKLNLLLEELDQLCGKSEEVMEQVSVTEELYCEADEKEGRALIRAGQAEEVGSRRIRTAEVEKNIRSSIVIAAL
ncbi:hypothetical protein T12_5853 [Trichinella patagoniensis]|uniref:Uncharacterized protein n=1 Tax=Trichinella patagoniensis TaxID=990121 RepID=A0A0V1A5W4_9BILA|nr:hypothetical protein T12_5853 [Trichinella patagoniensis]